MRLPPDLAPRAAFALTTLGVRTLLILTLGLLLCFSMFGAADAIHGTWGLGGFHLRGGLLALAVAVLILTLYLADRPKPIRPAWFLVGSVAALLLLHVVYALAVDLSFVSDFRGYWSSAQELAAQDNLEVGNSIHRQRAIPFLWPLMEIIGPSHVGLMSLNALMLCVVMLSGYDLLRRTLSHQVAQAFSVLWIAAPEPLLASGIPSHDVTAAAMFAAALWLNGVVLLGRNGLRVGWRGTVISGLVLGAVLFALDMARGSGIGWLMLASGVGVLAVLLIAPMGRFASPEQPQPRVRLLALQLGVGAVVLLVLLVMASASGLRIKGSSQESLRLRAGTPHQTSLSDGSYRFVMRFHTAFNADLMKHPEAFQAQASSIARSEFLDRPLARIWSTLGRISGLSRLGSQQYFYLSKRAEQPPSLITGAIQYNTFYTVVFSLLALFGLAKLLRAPLQSPVILQQAALIGALILALVVLRESQPRYIFPIWMIGAVIAAAGLQRGVRVPSRLSINLMRGVGYIVLATGLMLGLAFAAWLLLSATYGIGDGRVISGWRFAQNTTPVLSGALIDEQRAATDVLNINLDGSPAKGRHPYMVSFDTLSVKLAFFQPVNSGTSASANKRVCVDSPQPLALTFQYYMPFKRVDKKGAFTLSLLADQQRVWSAPLPNAALPTRVTTPALFGRDKRCIDLTFKLTSNHDLKSESWVRASKVEIFYPHLKPVQGPGRPPASR